LYTDRRDRNVRDTANQHTQLCVWHTKPCIIYVLCLSRAVLLDDTRTKLHMCFLCISAWSIA
jgi:hypothetical protein